MNFARWLNWVKPCWEQSNETFLTNNDLRLIARVAGLQSNPTHDRDTRSRALSNCAIPNHTAAANRSSQPLTIA
jgi:hypothetical protein